MLKKLLPSLLQKEIVLIGISLLFSIVLFAQQRTAVTGNVFSGDGVSLPGVSVNVKGNSGGTTTDAKGKFTIQAIRGSTLVLSFIGYKEKEILINDPASPLNIQMVLKDSALGEVIVVGYGEQKKSTITGAISTVKGEDLVSAPIAGISNTLGGRLPGLVSLQSSGQPGYDAATLSIRGFGNALVIVDGVESSLNNIDANDVGSVSILKDGSASIYGSRAGNGVLLVTTKRGKTGKPTITFNTSQTLQGITDMPKTESSGQYAEMARESWIQSGKPDSTAPYTPSQIQKYYSGGDPQYPNTNWYDVLVRDWAPQQQHNLSVRGGSDKIKYYGSVGYLDQQTMWKTNGGGYDRYNLRSNIDIKILDNLSLALDLSGINEKSIYGASPQSAGSTLNAWVALWSSLPIYPSSLPDPTKIPESNLGGGGRANALTNYKLIGYNQDKTQSLRGSLSLNYDLKAVKGLSARAFVNYYQNYHTNKYFQKPVTYYLYDYASEEYTKIGGNDKAKLFIHDDNSSIITEQLSLNYDHIIAGDHHISALLLYEGIDYQSTWLEGRRSNFLTAGMDQLFAGDPGTMESYGSAAEMGRESYVGRLNYSYKNKYLLESSFRADASAKFPPETRWGYFPSVSVGWIISQENFMRNLLNVDFLKLRASYGEAGNDGVGNFQYLSGYNLTAFPFGGTYLFGPGNAVQGLATTGLANPDLTWEKIKTYNAGIDFSLWGRKLIGDADVFYRTRDGIPASLITSVPSSFGSALPPVNLNSLNDRGFELNLGTEGRLGDFHYNLNGNISFSRSKWDHFEEPLYTDPDQERISRNSGRWTDRMYGYVSDGLFTSQKEIDDLKFDEDGQGNKSLRPGDIKYKDMNSDGVLNWKDQKEMGEGNMPHWMTGINAALKYKNFDFSALFQGAFGYYTYVFIQPSDIMYKLRWTESNNKADALVPRLGGSNTNGLVSDYYYKKAGYVRLKVVSIGYNLPSSILSKVKISQLRIYIAGTNLITFDRLKKYGIDPESPSGLGGYYYPQQKTISAGLNISF